MSFTNTSLYTFSELATKVGSAVGAAGTDAEVQIALGTALSSNGDRLKNRFVINFPLPPGVCELNTGIYRIDDVETVEESCGNGCWRRVKWWQDGNSRIMFDGRVGFRNLRITYWQRPLTELILEELLDPYDPLTDPHTLHVSVPGLGHGRIPSSGYVLVGENDSDTPPASLWKGGRWFEYRGFGIESPGVFGGVRLLAVTEAPWVIPTGALPIGISQAQPVEWGMGFQNDGLLAALLAAAAASYWATKTGSCTNEDDRSVATQLLNFWIGEAENAWKAMLKQNPRQAVLMRSNPLMREPMSWPSQ